MAKKKGLSKTKNSSKKPTTQSNNSQKIKNLLKFKDNPDASTQVAQKKRKQSNEITPSAHSMNLNYSKSKDENLPSVISGQNDVHIAPENQSSIQKQMSESNIYNIGSTTDLKYLHKKFKRVASTIIDENEESAPSNKRVSSFGACDGNARADPAASERSSSGSSESNHFENCNSDTTNNVNHPNAMKVINNHSQKQQLNDRLINPALIDKTTVTNNTLHDSNLHHKDIVLNVSKRNTNSDPNFKYELSKTNLGANTVSDYLNFPKLQQLEARQLDETDLFFQKHSSYNLSRIESSVCPTEQNQTTDCNARAYHALLDLELKQDKPTLYQSSSSSPQHFNQTAQTDASMQCEKTNSTNIISCNDNNNGSSSNTIGQYVCSFCHLSGTKPSFLREHICSRSAHSNKRPYPCTPCGVSFKSRGNLNKHYRSRGHALKNNAGVAAGQSDLDILKSTSSDLELSNSSTASSDALSRPTSPIDESMKAAPSAGLLNSRSVSAQTIGTAQEQIQIQDKPYKPKFHKAAFYHSNSSGNSASSLNLAKTKTADKANDDEINQPNTSTQHQPLNVEYLKEHISKIISQNEAIMEGVEPALQKKYHKITGIQRGNSTNGIGSNISTEHLMLQSCSSSSSSSSSSLSSSSLSPLPSVIKERLNFYHDRSKIIAKTVKTENSFVSSIDPLQNDAKLLPTLQQQAQQVLQKTNQNDEYYARSRPALSPQPLNLSSDSTKDMSKKRSMVGEVQSGGCIVSVASGSQTDATTGALQKKGENFEAPSTSVYENHHPQNPERSIIKSLLLNSRGLAVPTTGEGDEAVYICPLCKISFRSADNLQYHTKCYCQGTPQVSSSQSPHSAPISPVGSPSHKYFRSNSFNLYLPEKYSPNTLAKLASSSLRHHRTPLSLAKLAAQQAAGYYLNRTSPGSGSTSTAMSSRSRPDQITINGNLAPGATTQNVAAAQPSIVTSAQSVSSQCVQITKQLIDASLPSPGPLLGKTRLVDYYNNSPDSSKQTEERIPSVSSRSDSVISHTEPSPSEISSRETPNSLALKSDQPINRLKRTEPLAEKGLKPLQMCGGEVKIVAKKEECVPRFGSSGGSIISIATSSESMTELSPMSIRTGLLSGGSLIEQPKRKSSITSASPIQISVTPASKPNIPAIYPLSQPAHLPSKHMIGNYFQFPPPINSITAYNPLTLPPSQQQFSPDVSLSLKPIDATNIIHGGKVIPFVPGIPGPNTLATSSPLSPATQTVSPRKNVDSPLSTVSVISTIYKGVKSTASIKMQPKITPVPLSKIATTTDDVLYVKPKFASEISDHSVNENAIDQPHGLLPYQQTAFWSPVSLPEKSQEMGRKSFNFTRIADNLSPPKSKYADTYADTSSYSHGGNEVRHFNFENAIVKPKSGISPLHINVEAPPSTVAISLPARDPSEDVAQAQIASKPDADMTQQVPKTTKFLRPTSLPLKPGTFTPKRHHGITPTANTLPLISPETPRPSKHCVQLYLNGHAYTYLGLKCSTKTFYCTVNRPQPVHFTNQHKLSIYSNWQTCAESNPHPLGLTPKEAMSLYDSRQQNCQRTGIFTTANKTKFTTLHSQSLICVPVAKNDSIPNSFDVFKDCIRENGVIKAHNWEKADESLSPQKLEPKDGSAPSSSQNPNMAPYGYESNEDYTYIRGRGRGRYVCSECGIRCKKPSMLKKHIRTHSNVRPYTCTHCAFSFKTKGNLTKHMKSKAHYKKCLELGINPALTMTDDDELESAAQSASGSSTAVDAEYETESDDMSDGDDMDESSDNDNEDTKSHLPEHEAAHCLLSLSRRTPSCENSIPSPNLLIPCQPIVYPYEAVKSQTQPEFAKDNTNRIIKIASIDGSVRVNALDLHGDNIERDAIATLQPIDLTKPRSEQLYEGKNSHSEVIFTSTYAGAAGLLNSLMTLSDKVPSLSSPLAASDLNFPVLPSPSEPTPNFSNDVLMQTYLTERALQKSKIKFSQMTRANLYHPNNSKKSDKDALPTKNNSQDAPTAAKVIHQKPNSMKLNEASKDESKDPVCAVLQQESIQKELVQPIESDQQSKPIDDVPKSLNNKLAKFDEVVEPNVVNIDIKLSKPVATNASDSDGHSSMDTLAEIAASSVKLDTTKQAPCVGPPPSSSIIALPSIYEKKTPEKIVPKEQTMKEMSAKNIATEFLKIASVEKEMDSSTPNADDSSESSDVDIMDGSSKKQNNGIAIVNYWQRNHAQHNQPTSPSNPNVLISARTVVVGEDGKIASIEKSSNPNALSRVVPLPRGGSSNANVPFIQEDGGPSRCSLCAATFPKKHQLLLHMNIHYMNPERKFRCESCGVTFYTQGRLQKHLRSETHNSKVNMVETLGHSTSKNPRPFECTDCTRAFRIHGHLAKHLRSKTHVQKLECLQKLPFGTYAEIERAGISLTDIDTTDCDNSLASLKSLARRLCLDTDSNVKPGVPSNYDGDANSQDEIEQLEHEESGGDASTGDSVRYGKKRKLSDGCKETATINESDKN